MMATAVARKRAHFTYIWTIENFSKLTYAHLKSPMFVAHSVSKAQWCIHLEEIIELCCWIKSEDGRKEGPPEIVVEYSLLAADGSPIISKRNDKSTFFICMTKDETFFERRSEFIPNNTLIVQCRMWRKGSDISTTDFCYARTRLETYTESFLWPITEFSALNSSTAEDVSKLALNERKVNSLKPFTPKGHFVALILYLKRNSESEDVCVDFLIEKGRDYGYCCEMSVLDAKGEVIVSNVNRDRSHFRKLILKFSKLISKSKLIDSKSLFLPNDTLLLRCSFEIYTGVISSEIEYCSPNVSKGIKHKEDVLVKEMDTDDSFQIEEYFIKEVQEQDLGDNSVETKSHLDSCKDLCLLKAALKYLHSEAILSDISLRIGTKLHPVHKNILCSRSPVFEIIFSKDMKSNIIEINEMDENTLCRLLQYIYTDTVGDLQFEIALDLFKAAADYQLLDLKDRCSDILIVNLSEANVRVVMFLANKYQDEKLEMAARDFDSGVGKDFKIEDDLERLDQCNLM